MGISLPNSSILPPALISSRISPPSAILCARGTPFAPVQRPSRFLGAGAVETVGKHPGCRSRHSRPPPAPLVGFPLTSPLPLPPATTPNYCYSPLAPTRTCSVRFCGSERLRSVLMGSPCLGRFLGIQVCPARFFAHNIALQCPKISCSVSTISTGSPRGNHALCGSSPGTVATVGNIPAATSGPWLAS